MEIKACGPGCAKCNETERVVKEALAATEVSAEVELEKSVAKRIFSNAWGRTETPPVSLLPSTLMRERNTGRPVACSSLKETLPRADLILLNIVLFMLMT
ncbi:thioredoxin family protein [Desulfurivibrio dismutans]|uniref:thioredoxin family protein n=1 Tax=Desulfurivibrio dismutans TaxID=1398908 RepID=UPI003D646EDE